MNLGNKIFLYWFEKKKCFFLLVGILILGLLLKILCLSLEPVLSRDSCSYLLFARAWFNSGDFQSVIELRGQNQTQIPPLFLYMIKCLMHIGFSAETAGIGINLVLGTFSPLLVYAIAFETIKRRDVALCAALLAAVNPTLDMFSSEAQRDMVYLFFSGVAILLLVAGIRWRSMKCWVGAGFACACAVLTRAEALECLPIVLFALLVLGIGKHLPWKRCALSGCSFVLSFAVGIFLLSSLMGMNGFLIANYGKYINGKTDTVKQQIAQSLEDAPFEPGNPR